MGDPAGERDAPRERGDREYWDDRYAQGRAPAEPAAFLLDHAGLLPDTGTALDVAGGAGRHAIWLAEHGLEVTLVDVSEVALRIAGKHATDAGVTLRLLQRDLTAAPLPAGPFDVVLVHAYLDRAVLDQVPDVLTPGGLLLFAQPTTTNLERHHRPPRRFLLEPGEMARLVDRLGLEVVELTEAWTAEDRHMAQLVARRPAP